MSLQSGIKLEIDVHDKAKWGELHNPVLNALSKLSISDATKNEAAAYDSIIDIPLAAELHFPLRYRHQELHSRVATGQSVVCGEALVHALPGNDGHIIPGLPSSVNGIVVGCDNHPDADTRVLEERYISIKPDSTLQEEAQQDSAPIDTSKNGDIPISDSGSEPSSACYWNSALWLNSSTSEKIKHINGAGIKGHGGGGFSLATKLGHSIDTLIVNAIECEPLISCDRALIANQAIEIMRGIFTLIELSDCKECMVALSHDSAWQKKQLEDAAQSIHASAQHFQQPNFRSVEQKMRITEVNGNYPLGAESVLVENLTGFKVNNKRPPVLDGICCVNIATCHAVDALSSSGMPPTQRIVTVCGDAVAIRTGKHSLNVRVHFGTPIHHVLEYIDIDPNAVKLVNGGPLCGTPLPSAASPIQQHSNCIVVSRNINEEKTDNCIRCGDCQTVCPAGLLPQELNRFVNAGDSKATEQLNFKDCLLCGCCDLVCPSNIALTNLFQTARQAQLETQLQHNQALRAEERYLQREVRLEKRQQQRAQRLEERKRVTDNAAAKKQAISDAIARAKTRTNAKSNTPEPDA